MTALKLNIKMAAFSTVVYPATAIQSQILNVMPSPTQNRNLAVSHTWPFSSFRATIYTQHFNFLFLQPGDETRCLSNIYPDGILAKVSCQIPPGWVIVIGEFAVINLSRTVFG